MTNGKALEIALIAHGKDKRFIAELLNISLQALYNKINNITEFKASEIMKITNHLQLTEEERNAIFFAIDVDE